MKDIRGEMIVEKFEECVDPRQICRLCGFKNIKELGEYMMKEGYVWDSKLNNYKKGEVKKQASVELPVENPSEQDGPDMGKYIPLLEMLYENQDSLSRLLKREAVFKYDIEGVQINKKILIKDLLNNVLVDFADEKMLGEDEIIETALIEYFESRGYENRIKALMRDR